MATLRQRAAFLCSVGPRYVFRLVQVKLGVKRAKWRPGDKSWIVPLYKRGAVQMLRDTERWMLPLLRKLLPLAPGKFVDVGANVGQTLLRLRTLEPERPWIGFEPGPVILEALKEVIALNHVEHCTLIEAALADRGGKATLYGVTDTDAASSMVEDLRADDDIGRESSCEVPLVDAATLLEAELAPTVGVVKIDVEGGELEVIRGLKPLLRRDRPLMICEFLPVYDDGSERAQRMLTRQRALVDELKALDYRMVRIGLDGTFEDLAAPRNDLSGWDGNYVLLPAARYDEIRPLLG